jgi:hypothetical protein
MKKLIFLHESRDRALGVAASGSAAIQFQQEVSPALSIAIAWYDYSVACPPIVISLDRLRSDA